MVWAHGCRRRTAYFSTTIDRVVRDDWDGVPICCNFCVVVRGCGQISIVNLWILDHNGNMVSWTRCEVSLGFVSGCRGLVAFCCCVFQVVNHEFRSCVVASAGELIVQLRCFLGCFVLQSGHECSRTTFVQLIRIQSSVCSLQFVLLDFHVSGAI